MSVNRWLAIGLAGVGVVGCAVGAERQAEEKTATTRQALMGTSVSTDKSSYGAGEPVIVTWTDIPGNWADWVALAAPGAPNTSYRAWAYTFGNVNGSKTFASVPAGDYVVRIFENDGYTLLAESAPFNVAASTATTSVSTDAASYAPTASAGIHFGGMAGYEYDWISIARPGAAATDYVRWQYTNAKLNGSLSIALRGLSGSYVARAHFNNGYGITAESQPFEVVASGTSVSSDKTTYVLDEPVMISFGGMQGTAKDWVAIAPAGSATTEAAFWQYTQGALDGSITRSSLPAGTFVARVFFDNSFNVAAESAPFTIAAPSSYAVSLAPTKATFSGDEWVDVSFSGMEGNDADWIGAYTIGGDNEWFHRFAYTFTQKSGTAKMWPLAAGTYTARAFFNDGYAMKGESTTFTVTTGVSADKSDYASGEEIVVRYGGMVPSTGDYVAIAEAGTPSTSYNVWRYTGERVGGIMRFDSSTLAAGSYVLRVYYADENVRRAESSVFTIH